MTERAVVFDLDGTLIDSAPDIIGAVNDVLIMRGYSSVDPTTLHERIGLPAAELFREVPGDEVEVMVGLFRDHLRTHYIDQTQAFPGALELLAAITASGWRVGVATTKPTDLAKRALQGAGLSESIDFVQGSEALPAKPDPAVVNACLAGLASTRGWMVGDRTEDVVAGRRAGLRTVAVAQGSHDHAVLAAESPNLLVADLPELLNRLSFLLVLNG